MPAVPFSSIFCPFFCQVCLFSAIFVWFLPYLPVFLPFLPVFKSSFSIFCPMLRLAGQFDTKERFISLAEQNWMNLAPLREYFFGRTGLSFGRKKLLAPPKKWPRNAYAYFSVTRTISYRILESSYNDRMQLKFCSYQIMNFECVRVAKLFVVLSTQFQRVSICTSVQ